MEQIKGLDTRKLRHRGLLMQQRTARVTPFPPQKKTKEHWNTKQKNMSTILMFLGVDFSIFLLDVELERIHFFLVWMQYSDFFVDCEILLEDLQFSSVNFHATQKITQSMTIRSFSCSVLSRALLSCRRCCTCERHYETKNLSQFIHFVT